jgi:hypothetical protein
VLAKMDTIQAKMNVSLMEMKEDIRTSQAKADTALNEVKE